MKINTALVNGAIFSFFSFVNRGFSFILLLVLAKFITPVEYGYLSLFNTVILLMSYFSAFSTDGYVSVSYFDEGHNGLKQTISCILAISIVFFLIVSLLYVLFGNILVQQLGIPLNVLILAIPISLGNLYANINLDYFRIHENVLAYGILSCGNAILNFILSIVFVKTLQYGWDGRIYAQFFCGLLFGIIGLSFFFKKKLVGFPNIRHLKSMLVWGIPLIPHLATQFIRQGCDSYIINFYRSIEDVGLFNFAFTLTTIITTIGQGFNQSNSVEIYKILGAQNMSNDEKLNILGHQIRTMLKIYTFVSVIISLGVTVLIPIILPTYHNSIKYFLILSLYGLGICVYFIYTNYLFYYKSTKQLMYVTFLSACLHLLLSLLLTRYSLFYTCISYVITQFIVVILIRHIALKLMRANLES